MKLTKQARGWRLHGRTWVAVFGAATLSLLVQRVGLTQTSLTNGTIYPQSYTAQAPGGTLSAHVTANVTLRPCPQGVQGYDATETFYISGGTGPAEAVFGSAGGGTCKSGGASGTVQFTPSYSHSGAWTIQSASGGIKEAVEVVENTGLGGTVLIPPGKSIVWNTIYVRGSGVTIQGAGMGATVIQAAANAAASGPINLSGVVCLAGDYGKLRDLTVDANRGSSNPVSISGSHINVDKVEMANGSNITSGLAAGLAISARGQMDISVANSWLHNNGGTCNGCSGTGVWAGSGNNPTYIRFIGNRVENNYNPSPVYGPGYSGGFGADAAYVEVIGNTFINNLNESGGQIANLGPAGFTRNWIIANNTIIHSATLNSDITSGIEIAFLGATITGNYINGTGIGANCIVLEGASGTPGAGQATISGNSCQNVYYGIGLIDAGSPAPSISGVVISGNQISASNASMAVEPNVRNLLVGLNQGSVAMRAAQLPPCSANFESASTGIMDSTTQTWGASITGSGPFHVQARCNGQHWVVSGE